MLGPARRGVGRACSSSSASSARRKRIAGADPVAERDHVRALLGRRASAGTSSTPATGSCSRPRAARRTPPPPRRCRRRGTYGPLLLLHRRRRRSRAAAGLPARHPARLRPTTRCAASTTTAGSSATRARSRPTCRRASIPCSRSSPSTPEPAEMAEAEQPERLRPETRDGRRRAPAHGRLDAALRAPAAQPDPQADRAGCRPTTRRACWARQEIARLERLGFTGEMRGEHEEPLRPLPSARRPRPAAAGRGLALGPALTARPAPATDPRCARRSGAGLLARRALSGVRRAVVPRSREQLGEQERRGPPGGRARRAARARLGTQERSATGTHRAQLSRRTVADACEVCGHALLRRRNTSTATEGGRSDPPPHARRPLPRLLALVLARGAGRAGRARRRARARLGVDLGGLGAGRGVGARAAGRHAPSGSRSARG